MKVRRRKKGLTLGPLWPPLPCCPAGPWVKPKRGAECYWSMGRISINQSINQSIPWVSINGPTFFPFSPSDPTVPGNPSDPCGGGGNTRALRSTNTMFFRVVYCLCSCHVYLGSLSPRVTRQSGNSQFTLERDGSKEAVKTKYLLDTEQTLV